MDRRRNASLVLAATAVAVMTVAGTAIALRSVAALHATMSRVMRSQSVLEALTQVLTNMQDAETGERGYIITGDPDYLTPYHAARGRLEQRMRAVDSLTRSEHDQQADLPELQRDIADKISELEQTVTLRATGRVTAAVDTINTGHGNAAMDSIRARIGQMVIVEDAQLTQRRDESVASRDDADAALLAVGIVELLTLAAAMWLVWRNLRGRERTAAALHEQQERLRVTLTSIGDAVITTDPSGAITSLNTVAEGLTGWPNNQALGEPLDRVFRIVNAATRAAVDNPVQRALREGVVVGLGNHTVLIARDGSECPIDDSAAPIRDAGNRIIGAVLVFRDVTERNRIEQQLRDADQRKDEFLAVLAHELRNPLAPLRNALSLMRLSEHDAESVERTGGIMERQLDQMVHLVDDLLDVSRITRNRLELRREAIDIAIVMHSAIESCSPALQSAAHRFTLSLPSQPLYVDADRTRLAQAVSNLLNNAIKYTEPGGSITLTVAREQGDAVITVRDNGIGVPADMYEHVFEMFAQVQKSLERSRGGLGIGLPLVRHIVAMHGGSIGVTSPGPGLGSAFVIRLPAGLAPSGHATAIAPLPSPARPRRILVADDSADNADSLAMMLRLMGHEVCVARDGAAAVYEAEHFQPDVALLDIGMPKMNGYEVARAIRAEAWGGDIVLVALTGWGQEDDRRQSREAGFDHHMVKPVEIRALEEVLA